MKSLCDALVGVNPVIGANCTSAILHAKMPFMIFQAVCMFLASHVEHSIHSRVLRCAVLKKNSPQCKIPTRPQVRSEYFVFGEKT